MSDSQDIKRNIRQKNDLTKQDYKKVCINHKKLQ